ncbi:MAG: ABC transporter ATP-binding protein [Actinomycetota bacterium]|nr:ABC transporter ATP-binding protein [Actinomycetota bacterium]
MARLQIEGAVKSFGSTRAVDRVDLDVADGEFAVLLGPSGCGKTTLLRLVAGLEQLEQGRILLGGRDVSQAAPADRDVAMVFQRYALYPNMTVFENIAFGLRARKIGKSEVAQRVERVAAALEISQLLGRRPGTLSGGQRQRVALARAISREPKLFLMDEPLSSLDTKLRSTMRAELKRLHHRLGATVLYVTHDQVEAMTMGSKVAVLRDGRTVQVGSPSDIYHRPADDFVASFVGSPPMNLLDGTVVRAEPGMVVVGVGSASLTLCGTDWSGTASGMGVRIGVRPEDLRLGPPHDSRHRLLGDCTVEVSEPMGHETVLHVNLGGDSLVVRTSSDGLPEYGEKVPLAIDPARVHLFDVSTGVAVGAATEGSVLSPVGAAR